MRKLLGAIFAALLLAACDGSDMVDSGAGKEDVEFAKSVFDEGGSLGGIVSGTHLA